MKKKKRRYITLIEIMIVIVLIGLISGALAFNMRGSLDKGKAFQTEQRQQRIEEILSIAEAEGISPSDIEKTWQKIVQKSPLADGDNTTKDGWGNEFTIAFTDGKLVVNLDKTSKEKMQRFHPN